MLPLPFSDGCRYVVDGVGMIRERVKKWKKRLAPYWAIFDAHRRWLFPRKTTPCELDAAVVVSLTSYPCRYRYLSLTLKTLLRQSVRPDRIVLWIAQSDFASLPKAVLRLRKHGVEIKTCRDIRSYKKIIPLLEAGERAHIVTADDDVCYWQTWLEELIEGHRSHPKSVVAHRAREIKLDEHGFPVRYSKWRLVSQQVNNPDLVFATGIGGVFYPSGIFHSDVLRADLFMTLCPSADDVWFYWMVRMANSNVHPLLKKKTIITFPGTQQNSLWRVNKNRNNAQVAAITDYYGFPGADLKDESDRDETAR